MSESISAAEIRQNLLKLRASFSAAALRAGKTPDDLTLLLVTKKKPLADICAAIDAGHNSFAENYVQEACQKLDELGEAGRENLRFDFIGQLQRNKAKQVVGAFELIHTVASRALAEEIDKRAKNKGIVQNVLLQINVSNEESKGGVPVEKASELLSVLRALPNTRLCGLMCIGSYVPEDAPDEKRRKEFKIMSSLKGKLEAEHGINLAELSMGMSHDFELAIEEGATIVRVGSAVFGERA